MRRLIKGPIPNVFQNNRENRKGYPLMREARDSWMRFIRPNRQKIIDALTFETRGLCAYCETSLVGGSNIDHIIPKTANPELIYDWNNLTVCCSQCNARKGARLLPINPFQDEPLEHIEFKSNGEVVPLTKRGDELIQILSFNRVDLIRDRKFAIEEFKSKITYGVTIDSLLSSSRAYLGCLSQVLKKDIKSKKNQKKYTDLTDFDLDVHSIENITKYRKKRILIESIEINNYKGLGSINLSFSNLFASQAPAIIIIGENGSGKSSILQAIVLALLGETSFNKLKGRLLTKNCLRKHEGSKNLQGRIEIKLTDIDHTSILTFNIDKSNINTHGRKLPVLSYGSTRILSDEVNVENEFDGLNILNLFNPRIELINAKKWLLTLNDESFKTVANDILADLLLLSPEQEIIRNKERVFIVPGNISLESWSDGYKSVITLVCDILANMEALWKTEVNAINDYSGIVLIDEIELHLHPKWKLEIFPRLRQILPQIQFIITTHDPLCIQNAKNGEVHLLIKDENGKVEINQINIPKGQLIDNLLTGEWFSLNSTLDMETSMLMQQYQKLILTNSTDNIEKIQLKISARLGPYADSSFWGLYRKIISDFQLGTNLYLDSNQKEEIKKKLSNLLNK